jgi:hypothetical protein
MQEWWAAFEHARFEELAPSYKVWEYGTIGSHRVHVRVDNSWSYRTRSYHQKIAGVIEQAPNESKKWHFFYHGNFHFDLLQ